MGVRHERGEAKIDHLIKDGLRPRLAAQVGATEAGNNWIGYVIHQHRKDACSYLRSPEIWGDLGAACRQ
jgi:hypothetical protein